MTRGVLRALEAVDGLPICRLRPARRRWRQEEKATCLRCPMIVTDVANPSEQLRHATDPSVYTGSCSA